MVAGKYCYCDLECIGDTMYKIFLSGPYSHPWRQQFRIKVEQELSNFDIVLIDTDETTYYLSTRELITYEFTLLRECDALVAYIDASCPVHTFFHLAFIRLLNMPTIILVFEECWNDFKDNQLLLAVSQDMIKVDSYLCPFSQVRNSLVKIIDIFNSCHIKVSHD